MTRHQFTHLQLLRVTHNTGSALREAQFKVYLRSKHPAAQSVSQNSKVQH